MPTHSTVSAVTLPATTQGIQIYSADLGLFGNPLFGEPLYADPSFGFGNTIVESSTTFKGLTSQSIVDKWTLPEGSVQWQELSSVTTARVKRLVQVESVVEWNNLTTSGAGRGYNPYKQAISHPEFKPIRSSATVTKKSTYDLSSDVTFASLRGYTEATRAVLQQLTSIVEFNNLTSTGRGKKKANAVSAIVNPATTTVSAGRGYMDAISVVEFAGLQTQTDVYLRSEENVTLGALTTTATLKKTRKPVSSVVFGSPALLIASSGIRYGGSGVEWAPLEVDCKLINRDGDTKQWYKIIKIERVEGGSNIKLTLQAVKASVNR